MDSYVDRFVKLYLDNNIDFLSLTHPSFKGFRTFEGEVFFDKEEINNYIKHRDLIKAQNINIVKYNHYYIVEYSNNKKRIAIKLEMKDNHIYRMYETQINPDIKRVKCVIQYDGSIHFGYQKQAHQNTIQGDLETALSEALQEEILIHSSGRTDKGVHAYNQVIHFDTSSQVPAQNIYKIVNKLLPDSIHMKSSEEVHQTFHSRYDIISKTYTYIINTKEYDVTKRNYEWYLPLLDRDSFKTELCSLVGTHDFTSVTKTTERDAVRTIYSIAFDETDSHIKIIITGNGFLRYMIRNMIAYAVEVSSNKTELSLLDIISMKDNTLIKEIAPAGGLYMSEVIHLG